MALWTGFAATSRPTTRGVAHRCSRREQRQAATGDLCGHVGRRSGVQIKPEQLRRTFQTNVYGMLYLTQAALEHLPIGGVIINCTSVVGYKGSKELLDYASTKGAITAYTRSLSANLVDRGIRVNAVAPGPIWTPLNPMGGATPEKMADFGKNTPMGRPGQPWEVATSFLFLACDDASYMTGQVLHPNGGTIVNG